MAAVKYEFSIGALKAFHSIFCPDILLVDISRNAVSDICCTVLTKAQGRNGIDSKYIRMLETMLETLHKLLQD